jgi:hypothetical protein
MIVALGIVIGIAVLGLSAATLAQRQRIPCTACRKGELEIDPQFAHRCKACGVRFRPRDGKLVQEP